MNLEAVSALNVIAQRGRQKITDKHRIVAHPALHKVLSYQGFKVQSTKPGQSSYVHPRTGAKATVSDTGDWSVTYPKPKEMDEQQKSKKMKVAAGGPGSGRHASGLSPGKLKKAAWSATTLAKKTGNKADHQKAADLHNEYADHLLDHLNKTGGQYSRAMGEHSDFADYHKSLAKGKKPRFTPARYNPKEDPTSMSYRYTPSYYD